MWQLGYGLAWLLDLSLNTTQAMRIGKKKMLPFLYSCIHIIEHSCKKTSFEIDIYQNMLHEFFLPDVVACLLFNFHNTLGHTFW